MIENNDNTKIENQKNENKDSKEKIDYVSFSEFDKDGNFIEAYGYFEKIDSDTTLDERVEEISNRLRR